MPESEAASQKVRAALGGGARVGTYKGAGERKTRRQLVEDVVRDLVSAYPGTVQSMTLPTPDTALIRLHRGDSTWLVSVARLDVTSETCRSCGAPTSAEFYDLCHYCGHRESDREASSK